MEDLSAFDDAAAAELARRTMNWLDVSESRVLDFILREGLAADLTDAQHIIARWERKGLLAADFGLERQRRRAADPAAGLRDMRHALCARYPGLHSSPRGGALTSGRSVQLFCSGLWVSGTRGKGTRLGLRARIPADFHIVTLEKRCAGLERADSECVEYGDSVFLQTADARVFEVVFMCPGRAGPVRAGDHVFVLGASRTVKDGAEAIRLHEWARGDGGDAIVRGAASDGDAERCGRAPLCFTVCPPDETFPRASMLRREDIIAAQLDADGTPQQQQQQQQRTFSVVAYNAWMLPSIITAWKTPFTGVSRRKRTRAKLIAPALSRAMSRALWLDDDAGRNDADAEDDAASTDTVAAPSPQLDAVVISGAFCTRTAPQLLGALQRHLALPFSTGVLGGGSFLQDRALLNGGVAVLSRFPIARSASRRFGRSNASGGDAVTGKGVMYALVQTPGADVHVVAAHLQTGASGDERATRARHLQLGIVREFVQQLRVPREDLVVIGGDLGTCRVHAPDQYERMLDALGAKDAARWDVSALLAAHEECQVAAADAAAAAATSRVPRPLRRVGSALQMPSAPLLRRTQSATGSGFISRRSRLLQTNQAASAPAMLVASPFGFGKIGPSGLPVRRVSETSSASSTSSVSTSAARELFTVDPGSNVLARRRASSKADAGPAVLDYILYSHKHGAPRHAEFRVLRDMRAETPYKFHRRAHTDLSSHFPVWARFQL